MSFLNNLVTWWNGYTLATLLAAKRGRKVGEDEQGNAYYENAEGTRRWVLYNGVADASRIPTDWHGWMHHTYDAPPTKTPLTRQPWEKDHAPNLTGTVNAYAPPGSLSTPETRPQVAGDYEAWSPQ